MTLRGLIAPARIALFAGIDDQTGPPDAAGIIVDGAVAGCQGGVITASVISAALIVFAFAHAPFRRAGGQIAAGIAVGLLVTAGWFATGYLGADDFNPAAVTSLTFIAPVVDTVQYVMLSTGADAQFRHHHGVRCVRRQAC